ncbi:MAG TPA: branched-chain amino acid ABC transporter permease [Nitrososphaerales archaeon]|nr:branched-chain amino acid ABC transporter permease [Nitrososphaerales archaeon]
MPLSFSTEFPTPSAKYFKPLRGLNRSHYRLVPGYLISSVVYGTLFALMAMGLTFTYMTTKVPNFAYGSFVTIGLYTAYHMHYIYHVNPYGASLVAFFVAGGISVLMYVGILRPLARRGTPLVALMIATFGVDIGFVGIIGIYTDYMESTYKLVDAKQFFALPGDFSLYGVQGVVYVAPVVLAMITISLWILFTRTKFGVAMRASVENASLARTLGINTERVYVTSWMLAGGFAGVAGSLYTLWLPGGTSTGSDLIVEIFASSVLGGLTSIFGALAGGLVIGSSEDLVTTGLGLGFGYIITSMMAGLLILVGAYEIWRKVRSQRGEQTKLFSRRSLFSGGGVSGIILMLVGLYIVAEIAIGFKGDLFVLGLVQGYGPNVTPYQKAVPLLIMVFTLLIFPQGLVSLKSKLPRRRST